MSARLPARFLPPPPLPADAGSNSGTITSQLPTARETHRLSQRREKEKRLRESPNPLLLHREEDRKLCEDKARELCKQVGISIRNAAREGKGYYLWDLNNHQVLLSSLAEYQHAAVVNLVEEALQVQGFWLQVLSTTETLIVWDEALMGLLSELSSRGTTETSEHGSTSSPSPLVSTYQRQGDSVRHLQQSVQQSPLQQNLPQ